MQTRYSSTLSSTILRLLFSGLAIATLYACSGGSDSSDEAMPIPCSDVCGSISRTCGSTPPSCVELCASFSSTARSCITAASTCGEVNECGKSDPGPSDDAGTKDANATDANKADTSPPKDSGSATCKEKGGTCSSSKECRKYSCYCKTSGFSGNGSGCNGGQCTDPVEDCTNICTGLAEKYDHVESGDCP